jgi:hypothetical protein
MIFHPIKAKCCHLNKNKMQNFGRINTRKFEKEYFCIK